jgi:predicted PolB exonuclease-like 3'-5' exonuclease
MVFHLQLRKQMKRLFLDIETSPNIGFFWTAGFKLNISPESIIQERAIICVCWKWEGNNKIYSLRWDKGDDKHLIETIVPIMNKSDEIIGHNIDAFDLPWIRTRAMLYNIPTNPTYKTFDTYLVAKKKFYLNSNKLAYLAQLLSIGQKLHTDYDLWKDVVLKNDKKKLNYMVRYCGEDVRLTEKVFNRISYHAEPATHKGVLHDGEKWSCPYCASTNVYTNKTRVTARGTLNFSMQCNVCHRYYLVGAPAHKKYEQRQQNIRHQKV